MSMVGADPDQLIALAKKMDHEANALDLRIRIPVRSLVGHSPWSGDDAVRFRHDWATTLDPQLAKTAAALHTAAQDLHRNAQEQIAASAFNGTAASPAEAIGRAIRALVNGVLSLMPGGSASSGQDDGGSGTAPKPQGTDWSLLKSFLRAGQRIAEGHKLDNTINPLNVKINELTGETYTFSQFDPKVGTTPLSNAFKAGGYFVAGVDIAMNVQAAASGDTSAMARVTGSTGTLLKGVADYANYPAAASALKVGGSALTVGADALRVKNALDRGDALAATYHGVHGAVAGVGAAYPPVSAGLAAWDVGTAIGTAVASTPAANSYYDRIVAEGRSQVGEQGSVAGRYEGAVGAVNMVRDATVTAGKDAGKALADTGNWLVGMWR